MLIIVIAIGAYYYNKTNKTGPAIEPPSNNPSDSTQPENVDNLLISGTYELDPMASTINWTGRKTLIAGYEDKGTLKLKSGKFTISENEEISGTLTIDMTSIEPASTGRGDGESMLANNLKSDDFFGVETFPEAEFILQAITPNSEAVLPNQYLINGNLTIKNITQPVNFPATIYTSNDELVIEAVFNLDRTLWDIRFGSDKFFDNLANNVIDDNFTVETKIVAR